MTKKNKSFSRIDQIGKPKKQPPPGEAERKFYRVLLLQAIICAVIIAAILIIRFFSPDKYSYIVRGLHMINDRNVTLEDLSVMLDARVRENDALSVFFHVEGATDSADGQS